MMTVVAALLVLAPSLLLAGAAPVTLTAGGLQLAVDPQSGLYSLSVDGEPWLRGSPPALFPGVPLRPAQSSSVSGKDALGVFRGLSVYWERAKNNVTGGAGAGERAAPELYDFQTIFKAYTGIIGHELLTFTQVYPGGIPATAPYFNASEKAKLQTCPQFSDRIPVELSPGAQGLGQKSVDLPKSSATALGAFPAFSLHTDQPLNWFTPQGNQLSATSFGRVAPLLFNAEDGQATMPLLLYNDTGRSVAFAPTDHFFVAVHETVTSRAVIAMGPAGSVPVRLRP